MTVNCSKLLGNDVESRIEVSDRREGRQDAIDGRHESDARRGKHADGRKDLGGLVASQSRERDGEQNSPTPSTSMKRRGRAFAVRWKQIAPANCSQLR